jgi:saccharopine dehydrogenase-like NADP-dependent oxidoreductase
MTVPGRTLVVGASGELGGTICQVLLNMYGATVEIVVGDYDARRGASTAARLCAAFEQTDTTDEKALQRSVASVDSVVVAASLRDVSIHRICATLGVPCIDVTAFLDRVREVAAALDGLVDIRAPIVMTAGFFPGLSGLLPPHAASQFQSIDELDVVLLQNTNARAGASGIRDMLTIVSTPLSTPVGVARIPGFSMRARVVRPQTGEVKTVRRIAHDEAKLLGERLHGQEPRYWTAWDRESFNRLVAMLIRVGVVGRIVKRWSNDRIDRFARHDPRKPEDASIVVRVRGERGGQSEDYSIELSTFSDYRTTALVVAALASIVRNSSRTGLVIPSDVCTLDEVLATIDDDRLVCTERHE